MNLDKGEAMSAKKFIKKVLNLGILTLFCFIFIGCGEKVLVDNGIYGFTLNEAESANAR